MALWSFNVTPQDFVRTLGPLVREKVRGLIDHATPVPSLSRDSKPDSATHPNPDLNPNPNLRSRTRY